MTNICCACGGPGMTQTETGKWLCRRHSPYTSNEVGGLKFDEYLKQKGIELFYLMRETIWCLGKMKEQINEDGTCPHCKADMLLKQSHNENCPIFVLDLVCDVTMFEYHPYLFFDKLSQGRVDNIFLQEGRIFGTQSVYVTEMKKKYLELVTEKESLQTVVKPVEIKAPVKKGLSDILQICDTKPLGATDENWF